MTISDLLIITTRTRMLITKSRSIKKRLFLDFHKTAKMTIYNEVN